MPVPYLLVSDEKGNIFELKEYEVTGRAGYGVSRLDESDFIELPHGSELFYLPGRNPVGFHRKKQCFEVVENQLAVAAFVAPAYTQTWLAAYEKQDDACLLPLYAYAAVGWYKGKYYTTALRVDKEKRQDPACFDIHEVEKKVIEFRKKYPRNRLVEHLAENCALNYHCRAAQNYFLGRWECPLPTARVCNASCLGCLSFQPEENNINPAQYRLGFKPTVEEIVEVATGHLETVENPVVSFGQGCEGEPLLEGELIENAIAEIRKKTKKGVINLNTNAGKPEVLEKLCRAGLQSIRISLNSAIEDWYIRYFNPRNYGFQDVLDSFRVASDYHLWISVNYFVFPGLTDSCPEYEAFTTLLNRFQINMIQWRNFNIDPDWYLEKIQPPDDMKHYGIKNLLNMIHEKYPSIRYGYFNPYFEEGAATGKLYQNKR
ncbi:MAG TPA: radical SAM protein [Bacteroidia bacterium]|nr:radical SAM protein [Bacteroidia bacterium]